jgi:hypothetical protein
MRPRLAWDRHGAVLNQLLVGSAPRPLHIKFGGQRRQRWGRIPDACTRRDPQHVAFSIAHLPHIEVSVFTLYRPIAAVLAALATFAVFATLDLLLQYATR